jgi:hypothetical protein
MHDCAAYSGGEHSGGEALWAELRSQGVDVLSLVLSITDTPAERTILAKRGVLASADDTSPTPGATTAEDTVAEAIANLENGPTWFVSEEFRKQEAMMRSMTRQQIVQVMLQMSDEFMGSDDEASGAGWVEKLGPPDAGSSGWSLDLR